MFEAIKVSKNPTRIENANKIFLFTFIKFSLVDLCATLSQLYAFTFLETNSSMVGQFWVCDMV